MRGNKKTAKSAFFEKSAKKFQKNAKNHFLHTNQKSPRLKRL